MKDVRVTVRYPLTNAYFAYRIEGSTLEYSGSSAPASIRLMGADGRYRAAAVAGTHGVVAVP